MPRHAPIAVAILFVVGGMGCGGGSSSKPDAGGTGGGSLGGTGLGGGGGAGGGGRRRDAHGRAGVPGHPGGAARPGGAVHERGGRDRRSLVRVPRPRRCRPTRAALFVVNVTKAAAGTPITCGATDANCLKLTDNFGEDDDHPAMFRGDTLVYYDA